MLRGHGQAAGISLSHPHSQAVGLPVLSAATRCEPAVTQEHWDDPAYNLILHTAPVGLEQVPHQS
jgi:galactose-1-phosphate uridylyltransferase